MKHIGFVITQKQGPIFNVKRTFNTELELAKFNRES